MSKKFDFLKKVPAEPAGRAEAARKRGTGTTVPRRRGRPPGKRSDPDFEQVTIYIRRRSHLDAKKALLEKRQEFSELVEKLISDWLGKK